MSGTVFVNGQRADKPGTPTDPDAEIEIRGEVLRYVSRGGLKLEKALAQFGIDPGGLVAADVGASTGGFTDCLLQNGAKKVYAIDVGYGQLAWKLRSDERVICLERTNIRYVTPEDIGENIDICTIDVSFISLRLVLPAVKAFLSPGGKVICLIKPQFEAGREQVGKKGVVRDPAVHAQVIETFLKTAVELGFSVLGLTYSPVRGPEGNIEYLAYLLNEPNLSETFDTEALVAESHLSLSE
jgi:23S rRNA (cytidine1920-2'-O)/16S rRNA (cytidine1409-2'-O)-methyltransferase